MNMPQPMVVANHLWASMVIESARSMPASSPRRRSTPAPRRPRRHRRDTRGPRRARSSRRRAADRSCRRRWCRPWRRSSPAPPARAVLGDRARSARASMRPAAVGSDQAQRRAADARLMRDLEPGGVAFARGVERHRPGEGAHALAAEARVGARQRADRARCSSPPSRRWRNGPCAFVGRPARCATARITCASIATGTGEEPELASCGLKPPAMRSAHCAGKFGAGLNRPK